MNVRHQSNRSSSSGSILASLFMLHALRSTAVKAFVTAGGRRSIGLWNARKQATSALATMSVSTTTATENPLLQDWSSQPFQLPPFSKIQTKDFEPALEEAQKAHLNDLQAIVDCSEEPNFENTIRAYDQAGYLLGKVSGVFSNLCSSKNTDDLQEVQTKMSPIMSEHSSKCYTFPGLFERIDSVYQKRNSLSLNSEQLRLVERIHMDFKRQGAHFSPKDQEEYAKIKSELATLTTKFNQNVLKDESTYELVLKKEDMKGCPDSLIQAAKQAATERNKAHHEYVITLSRSLVEPFLVTCEDRDLRKQAWEAWTKRGQLDPERDNVEVATKILKLRQRIAQLHGYKNYASFQCADRMAKTPEAVSKLLEDVWSRAKVSSDREREALEEFVKESGVELEGGYRAMGLALLR